MDMSERLYAAILQRDFDGADNMIKAGAALDGVIRDALVKGPSSAAHFIKAQYNAYEQFIDFAKSASPEDFAAVSEKLFGLVGEPLYNTFGEYRYGVYKDRFFDPVFFETLLKFFSGKQMRKQATMQEIIDKNSIELLEICARYGWLKIPRIRDAMIDYANKQNSAECTAWLLEFKNRTADLAAERARAEKRMLRELNADPNSLTELKKVWRFTKLKDGTLEITSYKGRQTEVVVPEKIGGDTVASIGMAAFTGAWYLTKRTAKDVCEFREKHITKITLPETITKIGEYAFYACEALEDVNIPNGVKVIENSTFRGTNFEVLELPESVERLADYSLSFGCFKVVKLPRGLVKIGQEAFTVCQNIEKIEIPERIKTILHGTFWRCERLKEVVLPDGMEMIKARAFWNCPELETINLPASIKKIENFKRGDKMHNVFADSPKLTAVVERGSYAERYCRKNGINYKYAEEEK